MNKQTLLAVLACFNPWVNVRSLFVRSHNHFMAIDGIRAFSMLYVVMTHAFVVIMLANRESATEFIHQIPWYMQWLLMGDKGVDAFFVLSGFLIARLLMLEYKRDNSIALKRFYWRRWLRLSPIYLVFLIISWQFLSASVDTQSLWFYAAYLNNFLPDSQRLVPWLWSLAVEEQFYLLFPLLLLAAYKRRVPLGFFIAALIVLSLLIRWAIVYVNPHLLVSGDELLLSDGWLNNEYNQWLYINLHSRFGPLVIGVLLAYFHVYKPQWLSALSGKWQAFGLSVLVIFMAVLMLAIPVYQGVEMPKFVYYFYHIAHRHWFAVMIALLIIMTIQPVGVSRLWNTIFSSPVLYPFAVLSYGMYLFHLPVLSLCFQAMKSAGFAADLSVANIFLLMGFSLIPLSVITVFMYVFVEKPFIRLRDIKRELSA